MANSTSQHPGRVRKSSSCSARETERSCPARSILGPGTMAIATGDFDGDGRTDHSRAQDKPDRRMSSHGNGDGTFRSLSVNTIGAFTSGTAAALAIGDFNGDGRPDIAEISNFLADPSTGLSTLIGKGDGAFAAARVLQRPGISIIARSRGFQRRWNRGSGCHQIPTEAA